MTYTLNGILRSAVLSILLAAAACSKGDGLPERTESTPSLQISDEISSPRINSFAQDTSGHIWIATFRGLNRHNAHDITQFYATEDPGSIPNNEVFRVHSAKDGKLWVSTTSGIAYYTDKDNFHRPKNWAQTLVYQIAESPDGRMFFNDRSKILEYLPYCDSLRTVIQYREVQSGVQRPLHFLRDGRMTIVWPDSLSMYDPYTYTYLGSVKIPQTVGITADGPEGKLWLGSDNGPFLFNPTDNSFEILPLQLRQEGGLDAQPRTILQYDDDRTLFVTWDREIVMYDSRKGKISRTGDEDFPFMNRLDKQPYLLYKDSGGNVWVSHTMRGYSVLWTSESLFNKNASLVEQFNGQIIQTMTTDSGGRVWFATNNGRLMVYDPEEGRIKEVTPEHRDTNGESITGAITQIFADSQGRLFICSNDGVTRRYNWDGKVLHHERSYPVSRALDFTQDDNGTVWAGAFENEIYALMDDGSLKRVPIFPAGRYYQISLMFNSSVGMLVGAHPANIQVFDPETLEHHPLVDEKTFKEVLGGNLFIPTCVYEDSEGFIWIGTDTSGLLRYDTSTQTIEAIKGSPCEDIAAIEEDNEGNIWVSSLAGLGVWFRETGTFSNYKSADGIGGNYFTDRCSAKLPDGTIVFGGYHGITTVNPDDLKQQVDIPLHLEYLKIHNTLIRPSENSPLKKALPLTDVITLSHRQNGLGISYAALDYHESGRTRYSYMMEGADKYWVEAGNNHEAYYSNLSPGRHLFRVRIGNDSGTVKPKEVSLMVRVKASPWLSWWAILLYLTASGAIVMTLAHYGIKARRSAAAAHKAEQEKEQERRINKMNMNFFANVAHEFRTPLTLISGPISLLSASKNTDSEEKRLVGTVQRSVDRMLKLVNQMMDFNRLEGDALPLQVAEKDIVPILEDSVDIFSEQAKEKGITLEHMFSEKTFPMPVDEDKLGKILMNLLSNSCKYTPEGGSVSVLFDVISSQEARQTAPHPENITDSKYARIRVSDSGIGVPDNMKEKIFERYFQVKSASSGSYNLGTGIGLYYVKVLTKLHHGLIWASDRAAGKGTTMTLLLPADQNVYPKGEWGNIPVMPKINVAKVEDEPLPEEDKDGKKTILVVDDEVDIAKYLKEILSPDYRVTCRYDAESALETLKTDYPDLILSDVAMPGKDGYELCREIKRDKDISHLPVILVTAKTTVENQIEGLDSGADAYVNKPFDPFYLRSLIRSQLDNRDRLKSMLQTATSTEEIDQSALSEQDSKFLSSLYSLMENELSNPELDVEKMAEALFISRSKLFYKVKGLTGETPIGFFKQYKLSRAAELLKEGKYPISQIADMTGFSSPSKFSSLFKKRFGVSPSDYKG